MLSHQVQLLAMPTPESTSWYEGQGTGPYVRPRWLVRLRGVTCGIQLGTCLLVWAFPDLDLPLRELVPLVLLLAGANGGILLWVARGHVLPRTAAGGVLLLDVVLLTELLEITGGPFNPFSVIYGVQVAVAAFTIGRGWAYVTGVAAAAAYGILVYSHLQPDIGPGHHRLNDFPAHLFTMWVAFALTADLVGYFASRASDAIDRRQRELEAMRARVARSERLAALTTLATGAAHELSTPLGTIAVAARELERTTTGLSSESAPSALHDDARLIRTEVDRCQAILDQMSGRAGGVAADEVEVVDLETVTAQVKDRLVGDQPSRLQVRVDDGIGSLSLPRAGLVQVMTSLIKNAYEASMDQQPVWFDIAHVDGSLCFTVRDEGTGVAPSAVEHVGEPFHTTKDAGRGLGLGLFLARVFAERFGGSLTLTSERGTSVILTLPIPIARSG